MILEEDKYSILSENTITTTAMVTTNHLLNEDDEQSNVDDVTELSVKPALHVHSFDTSSTTIRNEVNSQEEEQGIELTNYHIINKSTKNESHMCFQ